MFLTGIEAKQKKLMERVQEIRGIISTTMPGSTQAGVTCAVRLAYDVRERLEDVRSRHGLRTLKEAAYVCMRLGVTTLERLEPETRGRINGKVPTLLRPVRVLTDEQITQIKDHGFDPVAAAVCGVDAGGLRPAVAYRGEEDLGGGGELGGAVGVHTAGDQGLGA